MSLVRALMLSLGAFIGSLLLAGFPHVDNLHGSLWQGPMVAIALWGMVETARCLRRKWSLYHAGIMLLLYANLMILAMIVFLAVYP